MVTFFLKRRTSCRLFGTEFTPIADSDYKTACLTDQGQPRFTVALFQCRVDDRDLVLDDLKVSLLGQPATTRGIRSRTVLLSNRCGRPPDVSDTVRGWLGTKRTVCKSFPRWQTVWTHSSIMSKSVCCSSSRRLSWKKKSPSKAHG